MYNKEELMTINKYLEMFFTHLGFKNNAIQKKSNKEFCFEYKQCCKNSHGELDYRLLEENPIVATFKTIKFTEGYKVLINEYEIETSNLKDISKSTVSYSSVSHITNSRELGFNEFFESNELELALKRAKTSLEEALKSGKGMLENFNLNQASIDETEKNILGYLQSINGKTIELKYDFFANELSIFTYQNKVVVSLEELIVLSKDNYDELCEGDAMKNRMIESLEDTHKFSIQRLSNGYVVNEKYYETLEEYFEEQK